MLPNKASNLPCLIRSEGRQCWPWSLQSQQGRQALFGGACTQLTWSTMIKPAWKQSARADHLKIAYNKDFVKKRNISTYFYNSYCLLLGWRLGVIPPLTCVHLCVLTAVWQPVSLWETLVAVIINHGPYLVSCPRGGHCAVNDRCCLCLRTCLHSQSSTATDS